ncbi:MAG: cysteine desulfurase [Candidatus Omnitrophica bacterium]|nr:cysteine desulfurase [Candidatus Omnitrophota bacterium]
MLDVARIREDFPILGRKVHGRPLVYLDNAATSQKPLAVVEALVEFYTRTNANVHRGIHALSEEATARFEEARAKTGRFIGAPKPATVIFTRNATEAVNLVSHAWGRRHVGPGDEILLTEMEHHSNLVPWQMLAQAQGATLKFIPVTSDGQLALEELPRLLGGKTQLVSLTLMSNVLGTINPVKEVVQQAHSKGIPVLVDGAQGVPHLPVNVLDLNCDFLAFSAHKMLGPTGVGVLYAKEAILEEMDPFLGGGDMIRDVWLEKAVWNDLPWKFEAGTPNVADVIAFGAAIDYLERIGMEEIRRHEEALTRHAIKLLREIEGLTIYGPLDPARRGAAIAFNVNGLHPHDLGQILDEEGIAIRAGHHCCKPLMRKLGVVAAARASFYLYNTEEEAELLAQAVSKAKGVFHVVSHR